MTAERADGQTPSATFRAGAVGRACAVGTLFAVVLVGPSVLAVLRWSAAGLNPTVVLGVAVLVIGQLVRSRQWIRWPAFGVVWLVGLGAWRDVLDLLDPIRLVDHAGGRLSGPAAADRRRHLPGAGVRRARGLTYRPTIAVVPSS